MKIQLTRSKIVSLCLSGSCVVLGLVIVGEIASGFGEATGGTAPNTTADVLPQLPSGTFDLPTLDAFAEIVDRPLFNPTRRPLEADPGPSAAVPTPPPDWTLIGTVITPNKRSALLWSPRSREFFRLEPGMTNGGWELSEIGPDEVVLQRGATRHQLELSRD